MFNIDSHVMLLVTTTIHDQYLYLNQWGRSCYSCLYDNQYSCTSHGCPSLCLAYACLWLCPSWVFWNNNCYMKMYFLILKKAVLWQLVYIAWLAREHYRIVCMLVYILSITEHPTIRDAWGTRSSSCSTWFTASSCHCPWTGHVKKRRLSIHMWKKWW